ncbi:MAG: hypothetical protein ACK5S9_13155 [Roseiflexaceae bacterium]
MNRCAHLVLVWVVVIGSVIMSAPTPAAAAQRCFIETNQCMDGRIAEFWEQNGGLAVFGFPIGPLEQTTVDGKTFTVQRFERNRLELHPENKRPYDVLLGRLGADRLGQQGRDWFGFAKSGDTGGCRVFAETGHAVCGAILKAWRANGLQIDGKRAVSEAESLALFGMPLSGLMTETLSDGKQYQVQWFERARFELHPENDAPYDVLLGLLGNEVGVPPPAPLGLSDIEIAERVNIMTWGYWEKSIDKLDIEIGRFRYMDEYTYPIGNYGCKPKNGMRFVDFSILTINFSDETVVLSPDGMILTDTAGTEYKHACSFQQLHAPYFTNTYMWGCKCRESINTGRFMFEIPKSTAPARLKFRYLYKNYSIEVVFDKNYTKLWTPRY